MSEGTASEQPNVREWALRYTTDRGMFVIPIPFHRKFPPTEDWQNLKMKPSGKSWRYIRIFNRNNWFCNVAEVRFYGGVK